MSVTLHSIDDHFITVLLIAKDYSTELCTEKVKSLSGQKTDQFDSFIDVLVALQVLNLATLNSVSPIKLMHFTLGCSDWLLVSTLS